ncbi:MULTISPECIES: hypothetical protein [unclassified Leptolyngbya]|nr:MULTISPECIES: hypothetical protein [unclassified Leptolyngbya]MBN8564078.1 hypothetical protein [Leptolyngbya sp. UWPOB_LEPTO1]MCY6492287.1 hypothetical protein [Leptolyngbya sp. GGD]
MLNRLCFSEWSDSRSRRLLLTAGLAIGIWCISISVLWSALRSHLA